MENKKSIEEEIEEDRRKVEARTPITLNVGAHCAHHSSLPLQLCPAPGALPTCLRCTAPSMHVLLGQHLVLANEATLACCQPMDHGLAADS